MRALISGQAGLAVVLRDPPLFLPVNDERYEDTLEAVDAAFAGVTDLEDLELPEDEPDTVRRLACQAWALDRAVYRLFMLFDDPNMPREFETGIVMEVSAIVSLHKVHHAVAEWLGAVELGPDHEVRALDLAERHASLRDYMGRLYGSVVSASDDWERAERESERQRLEETNLGRGRHHGLRYHLATRAAGRSHASLRSERPNTAAEARFHEAIAPIIASARQAVRRVGASGSPRIGSGSGKTSSVNRILHQTVRQVNAKLQAAEFAGVRPYRTSEIRILLGIRLGGEVRHQITSTSRRRGLRA